MKRKRSRRKNHYQEYMVYSFVENIYQNTGDLWFRCTINCSKDSSEETEHIAISSPEKLSAAVALRK